MSKLEDFLGKQETAPQEFMEVEGMSLGCQFCHVQVDGAHYFPGSRILYWKCDDGHKSYMENFNL